jgi:predicted transcriptional regulator
VTGNAVISAQGGLAASFRNPGTGSTFTFALQKREFLYYNCVCMRKKTVSLSARLPADLVERADRLAREKGIPRSELIEKGLALLVGRENMSEEERLRLATEAMRAGRPAPMQVNWTRLEQKIRRTRPKFKSADEAMAEIRRRK